jgi:hypothetical protein
MSVVPFLDRVLLDTFLDHLALHFLATAGSDFAAARGAAARMVAAYRPADEEELALVSEIIALTIQSLQAGGEASDPDLPEKKVAQLRSAAVTLSREAHRNRRALAQYRRERQQAVPAPPAEVPDAAGSAEAAADGPGPVTSGKAPEGQAWSRAFIELALTGLLHDTAPADWGNTLQAGRPASRDALSAAA